MATGSKYLHRINICTRPSWKHSISFLFLYSPPFFIASFFTIFLVPAGTYHLQKFALLLLLVVGESTWTGPSKGSRGWFYGLQLHCAPSIPIAHRGWCPCQTPVPQGPVVYFPIEYINSALWAKWERKRSKAIAVITTHHNKEKSSLGPEWTQIYTNLHDYICTKRNIDLSFFYVWKSLLGNKMSDFRIVLSSLRNYSFPSQDQVSIDQ